MIIGTLSSGNCLSWRVDFSILRAFLQLPNTSEYVFATGDTGIHLLEIKEEKRVIRFLNKQEHLNGE